MNAIHLVHRRFAQLLAAGRVGAVSLVVALSVIGLGAGPAQAGPPTEKGATAAVSPVNSGSVPLSAESSQPTPAKRKLAPEDVELLRRALSDPRFSGHYDPRFPTFSNGSFPSRLNPEEYTIDRESNLMPWWYYTFKIAFGLYALGMLVRMWRARSAAKKGAVATRTK